MWVKDYMKNCFNTITQEETLADAVKKMVDQKVNSLIVIDEENHPIGIISTQVIIESIVPEYLKNDFNAAQFGAEGTFDKYADEAKSKQVKDFMFTEFHILNLKDAMIEAASYLSEGETRTLPVADDEGKLIGVITRTCIKRAIYNAIFRENRIEPIENDCKGKLS